MHAVVAGVGRAIGHLSLLLVRLWLLVRLGNTRVHDMQEKDY